MIAGIVAGRSLGPLPPATDPYFDQVSLLLHLDGTSGSTSIVDSSPRTKSATVYGSAALSDIEKKFGATSLRQTTTGDRLAFAAHDDFGFGSGDWTIEGWVRLNNTSGRINNLVDTRSGSHAGVAVWVGGGVFGISSSVIGFSSNTAALAWGGAVPTHGPFGFCRWEKRSGVVRGHVNGTQVFERADGRTLATNAPLIVGADNFGTADQVALGYYDEIRVTKGIGRTGPAPTAPFPNAGP